MNDLDIAFTVFYATAGLVIVTAELYGARRKTHKGDTISENWWWLQRRYPWVKWPMRAFLVWAMLHLTWEVL